MGKSWFGLFLEEFFALKILLFLFGSRSLDFGAKAGITAYVCAFELYFAKPPSDCFLELIDLIDAEKGLFLLIFFTSYSDGG